MTVDLTAPVLANLNGGGTFVENGAAVRIDIDVDVTDAALDSLNDYAGAGLVVARNGGANAEDVFSFIPTGGVTLVGNNLQAGGNTFAIFTQAGGTLTIAFTSDATPATSALVDAVLQGFAYSNTSEAPPAGVTLDYAFTDVAGNSATGTPQAVVTITQVNDAPVLTDANTISAFVENGTPVQILPAATVSDVELDALNNGAGNYAGATLAIARDGGANADDVFSLLTGGNITVAGGPNGGGTISAGSNVIATIADVGNDDELQLTFADNGTIPTQALVNEVLAAVWYANSSDAPPASVQISITLSDGNTGTQGPDGALSDTNMATVNITVDNDAPVLTGLGNIVIFTEGTAAVQLAPAGSASDAELDALNGGAGNYAGATLAIAHDGGANADDVFSLLSGGNLTVAGGPNGGGTLSAGGNVIATIADVGNDDELQLTFADNGTIPTQALVNEVLAAVRYANSNNNPPASVQIAITFTDGNTGTQGPGGALSDTGGTTVNITANNDAPVLTGLGNTVVFIKGGGAVQLLPDVLVSDIELDALNNGNGNYHAARLFIQRSGGANPDDTFIVVSSGNLTVADNTISAGSNRNARVATGANVFATMTSDNNELRIVFTDAFGTIPTTALVNEVLAAVHYANSSDIPFASVQISVTFSDGNAGAQGPDGELSAIGAVTVHTIALSNRDATPIPTLSGAGIIFLGACFAILVGFTSRRRLT